MVKKIKDLTFDEMKHICEKYEVCSSCPLDLPNVPICITSLTECNKLKEKLEEQIEVLE